MINYQFPYQGKAKVSLPFGISGSWQAGWHVGIDLVGIDDKKIYPLAPGVVHSINAHGSAYGNHITVKHSDGSESLYAHLAKIAVYKGQHITTATLIGTEGSTGNASGSHLHLEIHRTGYQYPPKNSSPAKCPWVLNPAIVLGIENKKGVIPIKSKTVSNGKEALAYLAGQGMINDSGQWEKAFSVVYNLESMLVKIVNYRLSNKSLPKAENGAAAVKNLVNLGIIDSPVYWLKALEVIKYLDDLLVKIG